MDGGFRIHALAQELVFLDQADLVGHAPQEQPQLLQGREGLGDVVVGAELHGLDGGFNRAMSGHERDLGAGQKLFHFLKEFQSRHVRHDHVAQDNVYRLLFEKSQCRLATLSFQTHKAESLADGDAEFADALLVIDDQQTDTEIFFTR